MPRKFATPLPEQWVAALKLIANSDDGKVDREVLKQLEETGYVKARGPGWVLTGAGRRRIEGQG
ncbi:MAG: hypothetical protein ABW136_09920 [Steroidobacteraceae bacterium]